MQIKEQIRQLQRLHENGMLYKEKLRWIMQEKNKIEEQLTLIEEQIGELENAISNEA